MAALSYMQPRRKSSGHRKAELVSESGLRLVLPYAPRESEKMGLARQMVALERPGRASLQIPSAYGAVGWRGVLILTRLDRRKSVEDMIKTLETIATSGERCVLRYGPSEAGLWRITELSFSHKDRTPTNEVSHTHATVGLTRAVDVVPYSGPLTGGAGVRGGRHSAPMTPGSKPRGRSYTVRSGDTLQKIAQTVYGSSARWKDLLDANGLRDARALRPGTVLRVP